MGWGTPKQDVIARDKRFAELDELIKSGKGDADDPSAAPIAPKPYVATGRRPRREKAEYARCLECAKKLKGIQQREVCSSGCANRYYGKARRTIPSGDAL